MKDGLISIEHIDETKKLKGLEKLKIKIEVYLGLKRFCEENSTKCFNKHRDCDECNIRQLINELEEEIFLMSG